MAIQTFISNLLYLLFIKFSSANSPASLRRGKDDVLNNESSLFLHRMLVNSNDDIKTIVALSSRVISGILYHVSIYTLFVKTAPSLG